MQYSSRFWLYAPFAAVVIIATAVAYLWWQTAGALETSSPNLDIRLWNQTEPSTSIVAVYAAQGIIEEAARVLELIRDDAFVFTTPKSEEDGDEDE